jgi:hypothetical protein
MKDRRLKNVGILESEKIKVGITVIYVLSRHR